MCPSYVKSRYDRTSTVIGRQYTRYISRVSSVIVQQISNSQNVSNR